MSGDKKKLVQLEQELLACKESQKRSLADYQNLLRRQAQERTLLTKLATRDLVEDLLQPLEHLSLAAKQLDDAGLKMVIEQLWQVLNNHGLEEIAPQKGDAFSLEFMEAVESENQIKGEDPRVASLVSKGYKLNGQVLKFAKVTVS